MNDIAERQFKTSPARRAAANARYKAKRGDDYKPLEVRKARRAQAKNRTASNRLAKDIIRAQEHASGMRTCINCGEVLPLDNAHFAERYDKEGELRARCRGCFGRYNSWSERQEAIAKREGITALKKSKPWIRTVWTYNAGRVMMRFYSELSQAARRAAHGTTSRAVQRDVFYEIAERFNRVTFLQQNSSAFLALTESDESDLDFDEMADTWDRYYLRWNEKANNALNTQHKLLNELENVSSRNTYGTS